MTARTVTESYEGGSISVDVETSQDRPLVSVAAHDPGIECSAQRRRVRGSAILWLNPTEATDLVAALNAAIVEAATREAAERQQLADDMVLADQAINGPLPCVHSAADHARECGQDCACQHGGDLAPIVVVDDENARAVAAVLNSARAELLANGTAVTE